MDWDDVRPKLQSSIVIGTDLRSLSVADLRARISACEAEIERVQAEIEKRLAHEQAASRLFKS